MDRGNTETEKPKSIVTFSSSPRDQSPTNVQLESDRKIRKRQNSLDFKKKLREIDEAKEIKEYMK